MNEYAAAAHIGGQVVVWVATVGSACCVVLSVMALLEIRKFWRWSAELSRERRRRHAEAMRRLDEQRGEDERRHAARMRGHGARIAAMRGSE